MDTSVSEEVAEKSLSAKSTAETETGDPTEQDNPKLPTKAEHRAERIRSSVARLTSSSINELEGLTSELNALQELLKSDGRLEAARPSRGVAAPHHWRSTRPFC